MTTKTNKAYFNFSFKNDDILLFGRESAGVTKRIHEDVKFKLTIPMQKKARSLNLAMSVAIVSSEAFRQNKI
jgi:tRNA (cytidine/uridine-2'-O-)-methyltransferase